jgi:hypothetical protein
VLVGCGSGKDEGREGMAGVTGIAGLTFWPGFGVTRNFQRLVVVVVVAVNLRIYVVVENGLRYEVVRIQLFPAQWFVAVKELLGVSRVDIENENIISERSRINVVRVLVYCARAGGV